MQGKLQKGCLETTMRYDIVKKNYAPWLEAIQMMRP